MESPNLPRIKQNPNGLDHLLLEILLRRDPLLPIPTVLIGHAMPESSQTRRQVVGIPWAINAQSAANRARIRRFA